MSLKAGEEGGAPTGASFINLTVGEVLVVKGFSGGYPVLTSVPIPQITIPQVPPSETGALNIAMNAWTDTIVALKDKSTTAQVGNPLKIDDEFMWIADVTDPNNLVVQRAALGSEVAAHAVDAAVEIWGHP